MVSSTTSRSSVSASLTAEIDANVSDRSGLGIVTQTSLQTDLIQSQQALKETQRGEGGKGGDINATVKNYEYLPHTADIQLHAWGVDLPTALSGLAVAMFGYMTDLNLITPGFGDQTGGREIIVKGHDLHSMVYSFLDEWLYRFHSEGFICSHVSVYSINSVTSECKTSGRGEVFNMEKHKQGTEVKAITYSNMQVVKKDGRVDVYVIIDI
ncbi:hypothetical protein TrCOL_g7384 [Triparma columacea]|uniref:Protein archease-like n=1 Tax=Triparma columacea TaxID=722753 RepID=A0A9W7GE77_9STRA|nr:hypothetical protein TrCOL_g7384 [Triparma columacea]